MPACVAHADKAYQSSAARRHAIDKAINNSNERNAATTPRLKKSYLTKLNVRENIFLLPISTLSIPVPSKIDCDNCQRCLLKDSDEVFEDNEFFLLKQELWMRC